MNRILLTVAWLAFSITAKAGAFTSTASGNFADGATWVGGTAPSAAGDTWTIAAGHDVVYNTDNSAGTGWGASVVTGNLVMTNTGALAFLRMKGNLSGSGNWRIGSSNTPITFLAGVAPAVVIEFTNTAQCTMLGTNNLGFYGNPSHLANAWLSATCLVSATSITLSNVPLSIEQNDVLWMAQPATLGQAGEYYIVDSVAGNTVNFKQSFGVETNYWTGTSFRTNALAARGIGCQVSFIQQPVVIYETTVRTVATITQSKSNILTGVRLQNLGRGLATSISSSDWTAYSNTVNHCSNGGFGYLFCPRWTVYANTINDCTAGGIAASSCASWIVMNNTVNACMNGGMANGNCSSWTVYGNTVNNCSNGGIANTGCNLWTVYSNKVYNVSYAGLAYSSCSAWNVYSNAIVNVSNGGMAYTSCAGWSVWSNSVVGVTNGGFAVNCYDWFVSNNSIKDCSSGALGYSFCHSWMAQSNVFDNCTLGSIAAASCSGFISSGNVFTNSYPLYVSCNWMTSTDNAAYTTDTLSVSYSGYDCLIFTPEFWLGNYGTVTKTNLLGVSGDFLHSITITNQPVAYNIPISVRPFGSRIVSVFAYQTNGVAYYAQVTPGGMRAASPTSATLVAAAAASGGWTNLVLTITNTNSVPISYALWVDARATTANTVGYSYVNVASKDAISLTQ